MEYMKAELAELRQTLSVMQVRLQKANDEVRTLTDENAFFKERYGSMKSELTTVHTSTMAMQQRLQQSAAALEQSQKQISSMQSVQAIIEDKLRETARALEQSLQEQDAARDECDMWRHKYTDLAKQTGQPLEEAPLTPAAAAASATTTTSSATTTTATAAPATPASAVSRLVQRFELPDSNGAAGAQSASLPSPALSRRGSDNSRPASATNASEADQQQPANEQSFLDVRSDTARAKDSAYYSGVSSTTSRSLNLPNDEAVDTRSPKVPSWHTSDDDYSSVANGSASKRTHRSQVLSIAAVDALLKEVHSDSASAPPMPATSPKGDGDFATLSLEEQYAALQMELESFSVPAAPQPAPSQHVRGPSSLGPHRVPSRSRINEPNGVFGVVPAQVREEGARRSMDIFKALGSLERQLDMLHGPRGGAAAAPGSTSSPTSSTFPHRQEVPSTYAPARSSSRYNEPKQQYTSASQSEVGTASTYHQDEYRTLPHMSHSEVPPPLHRANTMPIAISAASPAIAGVKHSTVSMPPSPAAPYASSPVDSLTPAGGVAAGQHRGSHSNISVAGMSAISGDMHLASPSIATTDSYGDTDYEYDYADDYGDNGFDDDDDDGKRSVASAETSKTAGSASSATAKRGFFGRKKLSPEEKAERAEQKRLKKEEKERELKKLLLTPGGLGTIRMGGL
ncbi:hypothetical protein RI367_005005 [Sorochytrium milnesiophthora]